ncbi:MAG: hypothetical protein MZW92_63810 [Comamonadaceae bacterium]|nr:hypothetical protein [Comamonadaceae bacterium]
MDANDRLIGRADRRRRCVDFIREAAEAERAGAGRPARGGGHLRLGAGLGARTAGRGWRSTWSPPSSPRA